MLGIVWDFFDHYPFNNATESKTLVNEHPRMKRALAKMLSLDLSRRREWFSPLRGDACSTQAPPKRIFHVYMRLSRRREWSSPLRGDVCSTQAPPKRTCMLYPDRRFLLAALRFAILPEKIPSFSLHTADMYTLSGYSSLTASHVLTYSLLSPLCCLIVPRRRLQPLSTQSFFEFVNRRCLFNC
jgi:hypothetical protein